MAKQKQLWHAMIRFPKQALACKTAQPVLSYCATGSPNNTLALGLGISNLIRKQRNLEYSEHKTAEYEYGIFGPSPHISLGNFRFHNVLTQHESNVILLPLSCVAGFAAIGSTTSKLSRLDCSPDCLAVHMWRSSLGIRCTSLLPMPFTDLG